MMDEKNINIKGTNILYTPTKKSIEGSILNVNVSSKAYKQSYRKEWESMPDFQGWLQASPGEPTRAYCIYCGKTLHAHRLSLLKHMCTVKHSKAALKNFSKAQAAALATVQAKAASKPPPTVAGGNENKKTPTEKVGSKDGTSNSTQDRANVDDLNANVTRVANASSSNNSFSADTSNMDNESEEEMEEEEEEEDDETLLIDCSPPAKICRMEMSTSPTMELNKKPISTHVLDTAKGTPVGGLQVCLYKLIEGRWTHISEGVTKPDGRFADFIGKEEFSAGRYKLHLDVDRYFELRKVESFYPFIEVVFDVKSPQEHYHVPILLSPFGYTTYRGS